MHFKPIAAIVVLLLVVASLLVTGCASTENKAESNRSISSTASVIATPSTTVPSATAGVATSSLAIDANGNGKIDDDDVRLLTVKYTTVFETKVKPLITKAGTVLDDDGNIIVEGDPSKLTAAERQQLNDALTELKEIDLQINSTFAA